MPALNGEHSQSVVLICSVHMMNGIILQDMTFYQHNIYNVGSNARKVT